MVRTTFRVFLYVVGTSLLGLLLIAGLAMGWVRYNSPVSLNFLNTFFEGALSYPLDATSARISQSKIRWDPELGTFRFRLEHVTFTQPSTHEGEEHVIARFPTLDVAVTPWRVFWGQTILEELSLVSPFFLIARDENGVVRLGLTPQDTSAARHAPSRRGESAEVQKRRQAESQSVPHLESGVEVSNIAAALQGVLTHPSRLPAGTDPSSSLYGSVPPPLAVLLSYVSSVAIREARVVFLDQKREILWTFPEASLQLQRDPKVSTFYADVTLTAQEDTSHVRLQGSYDVATQTLDVTARSASLRPSMVTSLAGALPTLKGLDVPLSGTLSARFLIQDHVNINDLALDIHGEPGQLSFSDPLNVTIPVESLEFSAYAISHNDTTRGPSDSSPPTFTNSFVWPKTLEWDLSMDLGQLRPDGGVTPPKTVGGTPEGMSLQNTYVSAAGTVTTRDPGSDAEGHVTLMAEHMPVERLADFWPQRLTPLPRAWILDNMRVGTLGGTWELDFVSDQVGPGEASPRVEVTGLSGQGYARNMTVSYLDGMPPIQQAEADLVFARDRLDMTLTQGVHRNLMITGGTIALQNLDQEDNDASLTLNISGPLQEALALLDADPLGYIEPLGLDVAETSGQVETTLSLDFPLQTDLTLAMVSTQATAQVRDATLHDVVFGRSLDKGELSVEVDKEHLNVRGSGLFDTVPVTFEWEERFAAHPFLKRYRVHADIHEAYTQRSGSLLSFLPPDVMRGVSHLKLTGVSTSRDTHDLDLRVDMTPAHMGLAALGWTKPKGTPAQARAKMHVRKGQIAEISALSFRSGTETASSASVEGKAFFGSGGQLIQAHFDDVRVGTSQASVNVTSDREMLKVSVIGPVLDLSPLLDSNMTARVGPPDPTVGFESSPSSQETLQSLRPLVVDFAFAKVNLAQGRVMTALNGKTAYRDDRFHTMNVTAILEDETPVTFDISPSDDKPNTRVVRFTTEDAGLLARALGTVETMRGGKAVLSGTLDRQGVLQGRVRIGAYRLIKTPLLTRLFTIASLTGIVDALTGKGIAFGSLNAPFVYDSQRERLVIKDFQTSGASLGMTGRGTVWFANNQVDVAGSIIPAYVFNSLLGRIPIIGWLLTGFEDGGGLVGVSYTIKGKVSAPEIATNPLSALTPSFVRRLFSAGDGPVLPLPPSE